ncbi:MAG: SDR family NAD(P)-dependent oxidoreductase [Sphingomicrobium sp.]|nr:SDR family NAD(P)-dependent oxidoreductase [Sphingomonadales bacterium]
MPVDLSGRTAIITGAAAGLGRAHALLLAKQGAFVIVNDVPDSLAKAEAVVAEIEAVGGKAVAVGGSVTDEDDVADLVRQAVEHSGRIDILVNNAGILRDKSFAKMDLADFRAVIDVHLTGAFLCTKAVWENMRANNYGRIVMTTSSSGLYGNFGQANYGAAKMALVGLMQTLSIEGAKHDIRVNCLAPTARTAMTEGLLPPEMLSLLEPEMVSPALLTLVGDNAPNRVILLAGAGGIERATVTMSEGIYVGDLDPSAAADRILDQWDEIGASTTVPQVGAEQGMGEIRKALAAGA